MRVLICCNQIPFPLKDGYSMACMQIIKGLKSLQVTIDVLAYNTSKKPKKENDFKEFEKEANQWHFIDVDNHISYLGATKALLSGKNYNLSRFQTTQIKKKLEEILKTNNYDIIQLEGLYLAPIIPTLRIHSKAKIIYRSHNIEYLIWERITKSEANYIKKAYLKILSKQIQRLEKQCWRDVDNILSISKVDLKHIKKFDKSISINYLPYGVDQFQSSSIIPNKHLYFIGSMDWLPNLVGMEWFIKDIWPSISKKFPSLELHIAGRNIPNVFYKHQKERLYIHGEIESAKEFMNEYGIMLVPLKSGSGVRIKIIEGLANSKCILSTRIGAEGLFEKGNAHILIADTLEEFEQQIDKCINLKDTLPKIMQEANLYAKMRHDNSKICNQLLSHYETLLLT